MPQASDELRAKVERIVPGEHMGLVDCGDAETWLRGHGWQAVGNGVLRPPQPWDETPEDQRWVMVYLVQEWDYAYDD